MENYQPRNIHSLRSSEVLRWWPGISNEYEYTNGSIQLSELVVVLWPFSFANFFRCCSKRSRQRARLRRLKRASRTRPRWRAWGDTCRAPRPHLPASVRRRAGAARTRPRCLARRRRVEDRRNLSVNQKKTASGFLGDDDDDELGGLGNFIETENLWRLRTSVGVLVLHSTQRGGGMGSRNVLAATST